MPKYRPHLNHKVAQLHPTLTVKSNKLLNFNGILCLNGSSLDLKFKKDKRKNLIFLLKKKCNFFTQTVPRRERNSTSLSILYIKYTIH